jgi:hypothetical protein
MTGKLLFFLMSTLLAGGSLSITPVFGELSYENLIETVSDDLDSFRENEHLTKPTFGVSHETSKIVVDGGFTLNNQPFTITNNFHTPFKEQSINLGEVNSFEATVFTPKGLKVQEFLFGIPNVGEAHLAELGVEVWYGYAGEIEKVMAIQKSNVIDKDSIVVTHEKTKCQATDSEEKCDVTNVSMIFLEPLKDNVMAVKAIDYSGRYQITYLNEGVDIAGESLNPMQTYLIPSNIRDQGLIKVTHLAKYSPYWITNDGRKFERNDFGSFKQINQIFERFQDSGDPLTRYHSGFGGVMAYELKRATGIFDSSELISELPESFAYLFPEAGDRMTDEMKAKMLEQEEIGMKVFDASELISELPDYIPSTHPIISERITEEMKAKMLDQEQIAQKILEASQIQARYSKHSRS